MGLLNNILALFWVTIVFKQDYVEGAAPVWSATTGTASVDENVASGTAITVTQTLTNTPTSVNIQSSTPAGGTSLFAVTLNGGATGVVLTTAGTIDAETSTTYALVIRAINTDGNGELTLTITVNDLNDVSPVFPASVVGVLVPKDTAASTDIISVKATDGDATAANNVVTHSFKDTSTVFEIGGSSGTIATKTGQTLSSEGSTYLLVVKGVDSGTTPKTATMSICICVGSGVNCQASTCTISGAPELRATILTAAIFFLLSRIL